MYLSLKRLPKHLWEWYNIKKYYFWKKKVECSLFDQKWLIFAPSGLKLIFFKKYRKQFYQYKNLNNIKTKKKVKIYMFLIVLGNFIFVYVKKTFKKNFFIKIINIRSCAKVRENSINSLKLVYIRKNLKFGF